MGEAPDAAAGVVVAAAIMRNGRVLAARRALPPELAGQWEFPGGKVEANETEPDALVREIREELGVEIAVGNALAQAPLDGDAVLRVFAAEWLTGDEEARFDHDEIRWFTPEELVAVAWIPADRKLVPAVVNELRKSWP
jgi:8-oxo-dGTP diphosphatase